MKKHPALPTLHNHCHCNYNHSPWSTMINNCSWLSSVIQRHARGIGKVEFRGAIPWRPKKVGQSPPEIRKTTWTNNDRLCMNGWLQSTNKQLLWCTNNGGKVVVGLPPYSFWMPLSVVNAQAVRQPAAPSWSDWLAHPRWPLLTSPITIINQN